MLNLLLQECLRMTRGRAFTGLVRLSARAIKSLTWSVWYPSMYNYLSLLNVHHNVLIKMPVINFSRRFFSASACWLWSYFPKGSLEEKIITVFL